MSLIERHQEILRILSHRRKVSVQDLSSRLAVSEVTIRKDLSLLEEMGYLVRTRGGAIPATQEEFLHPITLRRTEHLEEKQAIARKAREFIQEGDTLYLDSGSTTQALAALLLDMSLRVVTNSIDIVLALEKAPSIAVYCVGGSYRKDAGSFIGPLALDGLKNFRIDTCFMGTTGFSTDGAFSSQNIFESDAKRQALKLSNRKILLADSSKYGKQAFSVFATVEDIHLLISDGKLGELVDIHRFPCEILLC
ncbi:MAG: transcriptional repressor AgaR [Spirochaetales bacterium]